jgi:hypothetical protein
MVVVPELGGYEDIGAFDEAFGDGAADALASFSFVLVVVGAVEEAVTYFYGLEVLVR